MANVYVAPTYYYAKVLDTPDVFTIDLDSITSMSYVPDDAGSAQTISPEAGWEIVAPPPEGLDVVTTGAAFTWGGENHFVQDNAVFKAFNASTGAATNVGSASDQGVFTISTTPAGPNNTVVWANLAQDQAGSADVFEGVFRVAVAPIKAGSFQLQSGAEIGSANSGGIISGDFTGTVDFVRGIVRWAVAGLGPGAAEGQAVRADELTYNAVYLQYIPLDEDLLGLSTVRLPLDGRVPIYRAGGQVLIHNTQQYVMDDPITKGTVYNIGRQRIAAVTVRDAIGTKVTGDKFVVDFDLGTIVFPVPSDITMYTQPFTVHHRIEDELLVMRADISGRLDLVAGITHDYTAGVSYVSSKLRKGDLFARSYNYIEQATWNDVWSDSQIGAQPTASFNNIDYPIAVTNRGAIAERWAVIFTGATQVRVVGENVGQVLTNVTTTGAIEPINPQTGAPYFSIDPLGWGGGWALGNVLRFNTTAAGAPVWVARTVLQGPPSEQSDRFTMAFRADVDA